MRRNPPRPTRVVALSACEREKRVVTSFLPPNRSLCDPRLFLGVAAEKAHGRVHCLGQRGIALLHATPKSSSGVIKNEDRGGQKRWILGPFEISDQKRFATSLSNFHWIGWPLLRSALRRVWQVSSPLVCPHPMVACRFGSQIGQLTQMGPRAHFFFATFRWRGLNWTGMGPSGAIHWCPQWFNMRELNAGCVAKNSKKGGGLKGRAACSATRFLWAWLISVIQTEFKLFLFCGMSQKVRTKSKRTIVLDVNCLDGKVFRPDRIDFGRKLRNLNWMDLFIDNG